MGRGVPNMDKLQKKFEHVIGLPLQQEGHGGELQTLEARPGGGFGVGAQG